MQISKKPTPVSKNKFCHGIFQTKLIKKHCFSNNLLSVFSEGKKNFLERGFGDTLISHCTSKKRKKQNKKYQED